MSLAEVKTSISALKPGMYVSRLDRSWIDTPFPLEGLLIETSGDIDTLGRYCSYVYVDVEKGSSPDPRLWATPDEMTLAAKADDPKPIRAFPNRSKEREEYESLRRCFYEIATTFEDELKAAKDVKESIDKTLKKVLRDLKKGHALNIELLKKGVEELVGSILRNPSALALLHELERADDYAYGRSLATSVLCAQFGRHLGLEVESIRELSLGGMLLDIGKVKLPGDLLRKREPLAPGEIELVRKHVSYSVRMLVKTKDVPAEALRMVASHHERADGSGYPQGITNDQIPIFGRIAGIVDTYDAMTTPRPYTDVVYAPHQAIDELYNSGGILFQQELVEQFIQTVGVYPTGSLVEFETGEVGVVIAVNDLKRLFPTVMLVLDAEKKPLAEFETINLSRQAKITLKIANALPRGAYGIRMDELFL